MERSGYAGYLTRPVRQKALHGLLSKVTGDFPADQLAVPPEGPGRQAQEKKRILVADDNAVNQKVASRILEKAGYSCDVVANGQEVLSALRCLPYDALLLDCQMPVMDGFEATRRIRSMASGPRDIPIVAVSAGVTVEERRQCQESGMNAFVAKPLQAERLLQLLQEVLSP